MSVLEFSHPRSLQVTIESLNSTSCSLGLDSKQIWFNEIWNSDALFEQLVVAVREDPNLETCILHTTCSSGMRSPCNHPDDVGSRVWRTQLWIKFRPPWRPRSVESSFRWTWLGQLAGDVAVGVLFSDVHDVSYDFLFTSLICVSETVYAQTCPVSLIMQLSLFFLYTYWSWRLFFFLSCVHALNTTCTSSLYSVIAEPYVTGRHISPINFEKEVLTLRPQRGKEAALMKRDHSRVRCHSFDNTWFP